MPYNPRHRITIADAIASQAATLALKQPKGTCFKLRNLFTKKSWELLGKKHRIQAGRIFAELQRSGLAPRVKYLGVNQSNHHIYERV